MTFLSNLWRSAFETGYPPEFWVLIAIAGTTITATSTPTFWKFLRHIVTLAHEGGHAVVGVLSGRKLNGIKLHSDTSGITTTSGVRWGVSGVLTTFAGYPAPAAVGGLILLGTSIGRANLTAAMMIFVLLLLLLFTRNLWGILVTGGTLLILTGTLAFLPTLFVQIFILLIAGILICGSFRTLLEERRSRNAGSKETDIAVLGDRTVFPATFWWIIAIACSVTWFVLPLVFSF